MKVGVFLHGTAIMHAAAAGAERDERVRQVLRRDPSVRDFASYVPTPGTARKLAAWQRHGATIVYLSSHRHRDDIRADESVIGRHGFPAGPVHGREEGEDYGSLVERLGLDVLVEDDCQSIGGTAHTCAAELNPASRQSLRCLILPEFHGLADLPDDPSELLKPGRTASQGGHLLCAGAPGRGCGGDCTICRMRAPWIVTLVCGASGTGKSCLARPLAKRYGVPLAEADDIVTALQAVTTPEQQPVLHFWETHPQFRSWAPERIAARHFEVAGALRPAYAAVIADHVQFATPVVFEGDYLLPELATEAGPAVRAVVLDEQDEDQLIANYLRREPGPRQRDRARVSALVSVELARRARHCGVPVVPARPWGGGLDRVDKALRET